MQISEAKGDVSIQPPTSSEATALLQIATRVSCDPGIDCPNANDFECDVIPFEEATSTDPQTFSGSNSGTVVEFINFVEPTITKEYIRC